MQTLTISVPEKLRAFVDEEARTLGYRGVNEYVKALLRAAQRKRAQEKIESLILEGLNSGPAEEMTPADWDEIERQGLELLNSRKRARERS